MNAHTPTPYLAEGGMILDEHLSLPCRVDEGGCGAARGENCAPSCVSNNDLFDDDETIEWRDPDDYRDMLIDRELDVI